MAIEFKKEILYSRLLDPSKGFAETGYDLEVRADPLTLKTSHLNKTRRALERKDLSPLIQESMEKCPFCPQAIDTVTPKFVPELLPQGRIQVGEACVLPNVRPYTLYSAITVLSSQHFVGLPDFSQEMLTNGLIASQLFLKRVQEYDTKAKYLYIGWNYMSPAGSSHVHPHLHVEADYFPTVYQKELMEASQRYYTTNGTNFWSDLITKEQQLGERYIGNTDSICWLTSFAPRGRLLDILAIFQHKDSLLNISDQEFRHFSAGLERVFRYIDEQNFYSFNLSITSGIAGEDHFWTQARIIPRMTLGLDTSDCSYHEAIHDFHLVARSPEDNCRELKKYF